MPSSSDASSVPCGPRHGAGGHDGDLGLEILEAVLEERLDVLGQDVGVRLEAGRRLDHGDRHRLLVRFQQQLVDPSTDARRLS
jgi:hypothetical protein